jgi:hypothetical protein
MSSIDQWQGVLHKLAKAAIDNGVSDRMGTVDQVWSQNGEQKVRVNMGIRPDGTPWLSPWLHTEDHRGSHRHEEKYRKGMTVKLSAVGGDFRQATVSPHAENQAHPRPDHADEAHHTYQNDTLRERHGQDFQELWLAKQSEDPQNGSKLNDPDADSAVLVRMGAKPQQQNDTGQPGDGPPTSGGKPQGVYLVKTRKQPQTMSGRLHGRKRPGVLRSIASIIAAGVSGGAPTGGAPTATQQPQSITHSVNAKASDGGDGDHVVQMLEGVGITHKTILDLVHKVTNNWTSTVGQNWVANVSQAIQHTAQQITQSAQTTFSREAQQTISDSAPQINHDGATNVSGTLGVTQGVTGLAFNLLSDRSLKANVRQVDAFGRDCLEKVRALKVYRYEIDGDTRIGLLADEVRAIEPALVRETSMDGKTLLTLDVGGLLAVVIQALQSKET